MFAFNLASAQDTSTMALWLANVPYTFTADSELWVASVAATPALAIITEEWATGD
jgi:hypothetical protein